MTHKDNRERSELISGREPGLGRQNAEATRSPGLGGGAALLHTLEALAAEDWQIRMRAVEALGQMSSEQALDSLAHSLQRDGSPHVRGRAAEALGRLGSDEAMNVLLQALNDGTSSAVVAAGLAYFPRREAIERLVDALAEARQDDWRQVIDALVKIGSMAAPRLVDALKDANTFVVSGALEALGLIGAQFEDREERGRYFDAVISFTRHQNYQIRNSAYLAIGRLRDPRALPLLTGSWSDNLASYYNRAAMQAAGELGEMAIPTILHAMLGEDQTASRNASGAFHFLPPDSIPALVAQMAARKASRRRILLSRIESLNDASVAVLRGLLSSDEENIRQTAAAMLGALETSRAQTTDVGLEVALRHPDPLVRLRAVSQMGYASWHHTELVPILIELAQDVDKHVRAAAVRTLGRRRQGGQILVDALSDEYFSVRLEAVRALGASPSTEGTQVLIEVLRGPERALHAAVAEALRDVRGEEVVSVLIEALGDSYTTATRRKAARALAEQVSPRGVAPLIAAIDDRNHNIRLAAAKALRLLIRRLPKQDHEAAIEALWEGLTHSSSTMRLHAAYNLGCLGDSYAADILEEALLGDEPTPYLNAQAIRDALNRIP
ncbi:MAG: HEAT repeat domain-containing protein [Anaerolineae bacterium]|nr:HEAT repeat domain-containing protein [Anaerolineae bacterium]